MPENCDGARKTRTNHERYRTFSDVYCEDSNFRLRGLSDLLGPNITNDVIVILIDIIKEVINNQLQGEETQKVFVFSETDSQQS